MAQLIVRNLEDDVKNRLAEMARQHGRSMEEEVRAILRSAVGSSPASNEGEGLGTRITSLFKDFSFKDSEIVEVHQYQMRIPDFSDDET